MFFFLNLAKNKIEPFMELKLEFKSYKIRKLNSLFFTTIYAFNYSIINFHIQVKYVR
jgi:hypothetical protein